MEEIQYKPDGQLFTVLAGTAINTLKEIECSVDESYDEIVGIEAHEVSDGGSPYYRIGFKDEEKSYLPIVHKNAIMTTAAVPQNAKMRAINAPIRNNKKFTVQIYNGTLLATDLKVELVFTLRRKVTATR